MAEYVICTRDGVIYTEQLDANNLDLEGLLFCPEGGGLPYGLGAEPHYDFPVRPSGAELASLLSEGVLHVATERVARGLPGAVAGAAHAGLLTSETRVCPRAILVDRPLADAVSLMLAVSLAPPFKGPATMPDTLRSMVA